MILLWVVLITGIQFQMRYTGRAPSAFITMNATFEPFALVSNYGPFAVMTRTRPEIIIEGSADGVTWTEYDFKYKPGNVKRAPKWNIPHQPRLDWQLWFAAIDAPRINPWVVQFMQRLLEGSPDVSALLRRNPFAAKPPLYVRALLYDYRFSTKQEREQGLYWRRELQGEYIPAP